MNDMINLQYQDSTGNWRTVNTTMNIPAMIRQGMQNLQAFYNGSRIRAVDAFGRVVDIL